MKTIFQKARRRSADRSENLSASLATLFASKEIGFFTVLCFNDNCPLKASA
jgi:hypothetical protein